MTSFLHKLTGLFYSAIEMIVALIGGMGYIGIVVLMALESSFFPFPSEVVIPTAGYLTVHGDMSIYLVIFAGILGSLIGSTFNYVIAYKFGRTFLEKYSKFLFLTPEKLSKMDLFFEKHGEITTLVGRLIPVVRQYISFPAGLCRMNYPKFAIYTTLGASVWVVILALVGRAVGNNIELVKEYLSKVTVITIPVLLLCVAGYVYLHKRKKD